jgi:hypothetical protein
MTTPVSFVACEGGSGRMEAVMGGTLVGYVSYWPTRNSETDDNGAFRE